MIRIAISAFLLTCFAFASAQVANVEQVDSAFTILEAIDNGGSIKIVQPQSLNSIVGYDNDGQIRSKGGKAQESGYRIQVFSDNNMRTAKSNAEHRKRLIEQQMPGIRAYLTYEAPYWRVRVGDFRTRVEADAAMRDIKAEFPAFANDVRLVRARINGAQ